MSGLKREKIISEYQKLHPNATEQYVENVLDYDYEDIVEHDEWVKRATVAEIVDWMDSFDHSGDEFN